MNAHAIYLTALLIGVIAGLRTFTAPAATSWAAFLGAFRVSGTPLAFFGRPLTAAIFTGLALFELFFDQAPGTASRKAPAQFAVRILSGALCGAAVAIADGSWAIGLCVGAVGAVLGTLVGARFRERLARAFRRDRPAAFVEDMVAIVGAFLVMGLLA
jgi:uncharacterized membrane protein